MCTAVPVRLITIFTRLMCSVDNAITAEGDDSGYARAFIGADGALKLTIRTERVFLFGVVARFDPGPNMPIAATSNLVNSLSNSLSTHYSNDKSCRHNSKSVHSNSLKKTIDGIIRMNSVRWTTRRLG